ncbi:hypothetical protein INN71_17195, partial [Nocardioides sp. ChNu-153]|uniref:hypothetical protein n=2 Tax=unclassified Nocardioides TaxID=2615069 RepID=UPI00264C8007
APTPGAGRSAARARDAAVAALALGAVGAALVLVAHGSAQQAVRSTGSVVLELVGYGALVAAALVLVVGLLRAFARPAPPSQE